MHYRELYDNNTKGGEDDDKSWKDHKKKSTEFANFYKVGETNIDKSVLRFNVDPDIALKLKARLMYLTGGYPVSQTHVFKDEIRPVLNGLFNNINNELADPNSPLYKGLGVTPAQVRTSSKYADAVFNMAKESRYKDDYITRRQIENRYEKMYGNKFPGYPNPTNCRKIDIQKDYSLYKKDDASA